MNDFTRLYDNYQMQYMLGALQKDLETVNAEMSRCWAEDDREGVGLLVERNQKLTHDIDLLTKNFLKKAAAA